ncbi:MAG: helix-turn-helix domain-containing protein [Synoicihabitans sp.]
MRTVVINDGITLTNFKAPHNQAQSGHPISKWCILLDMNELKSSPTHPTAADMVENVIKCKWSLTVFRLVREGINRPGAMERAVPGLTTKVLNERLRKFVRFGIFSRKEFPEIPPRVEYSITSFGEKFGGILDAVDALQRDMTD